MCKPTRAAFIARRAANHTGSKRGINNSSHFLPQIASGDMPLTQNHNSNLKGPDPEKF